MADQPEPGAELIIQHREMRFIREQACVTKRLELGGVMNREKELPDGDADGELYGNQILVAKRVAATRPGNSIRMGEVIKQLIAREKLE